MNNIIENYVNKLTISDIKIFLEKNDIYLNKNELLFTYQNIKNNWKDILNNKDSFNINDYAKYYSKDNFNKLNNIINEYRNKYNI